MEHVEEAGVHSGDSACVLPPPTLRNETIAELERTTEAIANELEVVGPVNVQFAVREGQVFVIEANPRASRTVPFVAKAIGIPLAKIAARVMAGATLSELAIEGVLPAHTWRDVTHVSVKEAVLPFARFPEVDALLGPEMRSTGEVMGIATTFPLAFAKSQIAAGGPLPSEGAVFFSLADRDKVAGVRAARAFAELGFSLAATEGTAAALGAAGIDVAVVVAKLTQPGATTPDATLVSALDLIAGGSVRIVVNTPRGRGPRADGAHIRRAAAASGIPVLTTVAAALAAAAGIFDVASIGLSVLSLQEHHEAIRR
jgi:carbamoyl-phosphate synthase large subunit